MLDPLLFTQRRAYADVLIVKLEDLQAMRGRWHQICVQFTCDLSMLRPFCDVFHVIDQDLDTRFSMSLQGHAE